MDMKAWWFAIFLRWVNNGGGNETLAPSVPQIYIVRGPRFSNGYSAGLVKEACLVDALSVVTIAKLLSFHFDEADP